MSKQKEKVFDDIVKTMDGVQVILAEYLDILMYEALNPQNPNFQEKDELLEMVPFLCNALKEIENAKQKAARFSRTNMQ